MDSPPSDTFFIAALKVFICGMLALLGGVVREMKSDIEMTWARFMGGALVGMFTGVVVFCIMRHYGYEDWITAGLTALAGYLGTPVLDLIGKIVKAIIQR